MGGNFIQVYGAHAAQMTSFSAGCLDKMIFPQWMSWLASVSWNYDPASEILGHFPLTCTNTQTYSPHILVTTSNRGNSHLDLCFVWSQIAVILYPNHQMPSFENQKQIMHSLNFTWARAPDIEGLTTILSHIICNWLRIKILFNFKKAFTLIWPKTRQNWTVLHLFRCSPYPAPRIEF